MTRLGLAAKASDIAGHTGRRMAYSDEAGGCPLALRLVYSEWRGAIKGLDFKAASHILSYEEITWIKDLCYRGHRSPDQTRQLSNLTMGEG